MLRRVSCSGVVCAGTMVGLLSVLAPTSTVARAQEALEGQRNTAIQTPVPRLIQISGQLTDGRGRPVTGAAAVTFAVYADQDGGSPLWVEVQTVSLDDNGKYAALLGSATLDGVPSDLFTSGGARWLGVRAAGLTDESRVLLLSVPYALKALDAETLGGRPASDYLVGAHTGTVPAVAVDPPDRLAGAPNNEKSIKGEGAAGFVPVFTAVDMIANSIVFQSPAGNIGVGTTTPAARLDVILTGTGPAARFSGTSASQLVESVQAGSGGAVIGIASGGGFGVQGFATNSSGTGVIGSVSTPTGNNRGVWGAVISPAGVAGLFDNDGGGAILRGRTGGVEMFRVDGTGAVYANSYRDLAGTPIPNGDVTAVAAGTGLAGGGTGGDVTLTLDTTFADGLYARLGAPNTFTGNQIINGGLSAGTISTTVVNSQLGLFSTAQAFTSGEGFAVLGQSSRATGDAKGVVGIAASTSGLGVIGFSTATSGNTIGVQGIVNSPEGSAVWAESQAVTGAGVGLFAKVRSTGATAGVFDNVAGGDLLAGRTNGTPKFRVDGSGAVFASAYRDLAGNPLPGGDLTAVTAGTGISGGGAAGDVSVALDTAFTDGRYSLLAHGHTVAQVSGAATLGANSFVGNQLITGNVGSTAEVSGKTGVFSNNTAAHALSVQQSGANHALSSTTTSGGHAGVVGKNTSGAGTGVLGEAGAHGVTGIATSTAGTDVNGVLGWATGSSGVNTGVRGRTDSATGFGGIFENSTGGSILLGRVGFDEKFRVDGNGTVFASAYRDLAGNPIPGGDITAVAAGGGLTGGGAAGEVTVALDTAYTDARYAASAHTHVVGDVSGAATLGANSFTDNQSIAGNLSLTGQLSGTTGSLLGSTGLNLFSVTQNGAGNAVSGRSDAGVGVAGTGNQGVQGVTSASNGRGVFAWSTHSTGITSALSAQVTSPNGIAGLFENAAGGKLLVGTVGGVERFRVDGTGNVHASSYRDLAGNPIPSGDITGVTAGTGLTGGGATGDVNVALNTTFTDGRYARLSAANNFTASQQIDNTLTVTGSAGVQTTLMGFNTQVNGIAVRGAAGNTGGTAVFGEGFTGVAGESFAAGARGVFGWFRGTTGAGTGVMAQSGADAGVGVLGQAYSPTGSTVGVSGLVSSPDGIAIKGVAQASTGNPIAVHGTVQNGTGGTAIRGIHQNSGGLGIGVWGSHAGGGWGVLGESVTGLGVKGEATGATGVGIAGIATNQAGTAGLFDIGTAGPVTGNILVGRANNVNKFRVDGDGTVFATAFNPGGADFAESVEVSGDRDAYEPGDVLIIDTLHTRTMQRSNEAYSTMVAGIYSTKPGVLASPHGVDDPRLASEVPVAVIGIVPCKVTTENGSIKPGDLLVTSSKTGFAMKGTDRSRMLGAVVGKALEPLKDGTGVILVLVTLQ